MRTLGLWIAGIFGLGLAVGSFVAATSNGATEDSLSVMPRVDCADGGRAVVEQVVENGEIVSGIRCVGAQSPSVVRTTPAPAAVSERAPDPRPDTLDATEDGSSSRSLKDSALIIGSAAGAGAGIGAIAKGKKGAAVGAAAGAVAGTVYDLATRNKKKE